jgi:peptidylprolyl isomerase
LVIKKGNMVKMHYNAKIGDRLIDTSRNKNPIEFKVGEGQILQGLDEAVVGLETGDKKTVVVPPEKAYGQRKEELIQKIRRDKSKEPAEGIEEGNVIQFKTKEGKNGYATVTKVEEDNITIDLNHPLAGRTINFDLEIVDVK